MNDKLAIITLNSFHERGKMVENKLREIRGGEESFVVDITQTRFSNGEAKIQINESVRGKDLFIIADIGNYRCTYKMFGQENRMSPDDHLQDIKRAISAANGKAKRITLIMPLLYASRQHRRTGRESLDCALALQELSAMGVDSLITFDAHDPNVQNAIPLKSFDNILPTYSILRAFIEAEQVNIHKDKMIIISPDTGAIDRAVYYANMLGLDVGMMYKRRDHGTVVNGKNPIAEHVYTGNDITGKNVVIVDDIVASGESVLDVAYKLKSKGAAEINVITTFAFFNEGIEDFEAAFKNKIIKKIYSTNLSYLREDVKNAPWFILVDLTPVIARIIDTLNTNQSIAPILESKNHIDELLKKFHE